MSRLTSVLMTMIQDEEYDLDEVLTMAVVSIALDAERLIRMLQTEAEAEADGGVVE